MQRAAFFDDLQSRINRLLDDTPVADLRKNVREVLRQGFEHFDLATREQLDLQVELLKRAQVRIAELEARVGALEAREAARSAPPG